MTKIQIKTEKYSFILGKNPTRSDLILGILWIKFGC